MNQPTESPPPLGAWSGVADRAGVADCMAWSEDLCTRLPMDEAGASALRLTIEEVCVNIGDHGYPPQSPGPMSVTVWQRSGPPGPHIEVEIRDQATPFHPDDAPEPDFDAAVQDRRVGGLGWFLIRQLMDQIDYQSQSGENCLRLVKMLAPSPN
jgi:serine/threonine-protein kinase RsbW